MKAHPDGEAMASSRLLAKRIRTVVTPAPPTQAPIDVRSGTRNAAVLILADPATDGVPLLFIRRSQMVSSHRGQIAFPGGSADDADAGPVATALREAEEELGIDPAHVEVLGALQPVVRHRSGGRIDPIVGLQRAPLKLRTDGYEVDEYFWLRLDALMAAPLVTRTVPGSVTTEVHFIEIGQRIVWGATAAMLVELMERLRAR